MSMDRIEVLQAPVKRGPYPLDDPIIAGGKDEPRGGQGYPYESWRHSVLTSVCAGGAFPSIGPVNLGFIARSVVVHNYSTAWFWLPSGQVWIPPKQLSWIVMCHQGTQDANVRQEDPPGVTASVLTNGNILIVMFTEMQLTPGAGASFT